MTGPAGENTRGEHDLLPRSSDTRHPSGVLLHALRPLARWLLRRRYDVHVHGETNVPADGPVILASNHIAILDGPLLAIFSPRAAHVLTKEELYKGPLGPLLRASGQIPLARYDVDVAAVKSCLRALRDGHAVGVFPEGTRGDGAVHRIHHGAAYLAMVTGAPVVPVAMLGTRLPGQSGGSLPPSRTVMHLVYGEPFTLPRTPWPRTREQVAGATVLLGERMVAHVESATALTGMSLPGPLPVHKDDDLAGTGHTDEPPHAVGEGGT